MSSSEPTHTSERVREIVQRVLNGDGDAFRFIVRDHSLMLRSYLGSQLHHMSDVDDLAQEVFIVAYRKLDTFQWDGDFRAWLRGIARKQLLHHFRTVGRSSAATIRFRESVATMIADDLEHAAATTSDHAIEALLRCIGQLPNRMRHVVRAGLEGTKAAALAEQLSTSIGAVYNLHYRANMLLRDCVKAEIQ